LTAPSPASRSTGPCRSCSRREPADAAAERCPGRIPRPRAYFNEKILASLAAAGHQKLTQWHKTLTAIAASYGVPAPILVAIWAKETGYGAEHLPKRVVPALATEAFIGLRKDYFRGQLIAALQILQRGDITPDQMRASWPAPWASPRSCPPSF